MEPQVFALHDSLKGQLLAKGLWAYTMKCLLAISKGTLAFIAIAVLLWTAVPENFRSIEHLSQLLGIWVCAVLISMFFALRPNYALGVMHGVSFDSFSSYKYEWCYWNELEFVAIQYYSAGVACYTFTISKKGRRQHRIELFVRQSHEQMIQVKEAIESQNVQVILVKRNGVS
jgi:hypothetical protein